MQYHRKERETIPHKKLVFAKSFVTALALAALMQSPSAAQVQFANQQENPEPNPADVESVDAIIAALYDVISGPAGQKRDWDRMRSLFLPGAHLIPSFKPANAESAGILVWTLEDWIEAAGAQLENSGFFEREITRKTESFGFVVHVFSTYESRRNAEDPEPFQRGINSIQLFNDENRWWIVNIFWTGETEDSPIPTEYLP